MLRRLLFAVLIIFTAVQTISIAQEADSIEVKIRERHKKRVYPGNNDWKVVSFSEGKPSIDISYGINNYAIKSFDTKFNKTGIAEIRLGHTDTDLVDSNSYLINYHNGFIGFALIQNELQQDDAEIIKINSKDWRIELGYLSGYGYKFGKSAIIPYTSNSFLWQDLSLEYPNLIFSPILNQNLFPAEVERNQIERINDGIRFGTKTQGGIRLQIVPLFAIDAGYEKTAIFPRHLFWKQAGSMLIEGAAQGLLDAFINEIKDNTPAATPIINFLLKNGLAYGIYELRKSDMNWPFNTEEALTMDSFKIGLTFVF